MDQRRAEDDDIEGFVLEGQTPSVGLPEGEVGQSRGQLAPCRAGRALHRPHHRTNVRPASERPREHPRPAAHLQHARIRGEKDVGEEGVAHLLLARVGRH
jgi:hypothetical protein